MFILKRFVVQLENIDLERVILRYFLVSYEVLKIYIYIYFQGLGLFFRFVVRIYYKFGVLK